MPSGAHAVLLRQRFLKVSALSQRLFRERPLFKALCPSSLWYETESRRAEMCLFSLHFFLFFTPLLPLALITWFVSRTRSSFFLLCQILSLQSIICSTLSLSLPLCYRLFVEALGADSYRKKGKSPLLTLYLYLPHRLPETSSPGPPHVPSSNVEHCSVATHNRRVGAGSHNTEV